MVNDPAARNEVFKLAEPPPSVAVPNIVVPCLKVTSSPSGGGPKLDPTAAVKVTDCATTDGFARDMSVVLVVILFTFWINDAELLPRKFGSPEYMAVIVLEPTGRVEVPRVAMPPLRGTVPKTVEFCLNTTEPVGLPPNCPNTFAVKVTVWPMSDGVAEEVSAVEVLALDTLCDDAAELLPLKLLSPE